VDLGFNPSNALFVETSVTDRYTTADARRGHYENLLEAIRRVPGVTAVGAIRDLPMNGNGEMVRPQLTGGGQAAAGEELQAQLHQISADYFTAMQIPLRSGRFFNEFDRTDAPFVLIVNEEFARRHFTNGDATTRSLYIWQTEVPIVGVVGDVRQRGPAEPVEPTVYLHAMQNFRSRMSIVARTDGEPLQLVGAVRQAIWSVDPDQTIGRVASLEQVLGRAVSRPKLLASLFAMFGLLGLSLGALGVYGVLAFSVAQRRQEIGVRMALGATPGSVSTMVVRQGLALAIAGVAIGALGAASLTGVMQAVLYDIQAADLATFGQVIVGVMITALAASWIPARRATGIDPAIALRDD
jgi:predicted permease